MPMFLNRDMIQNKFDLAQDAIKEIEEGLKEMDYKHQQGFSDENNSLNYDEVVEFITKIKEKYKLDKPEG